MAKSLTICDPPSGWRYGFPKPIPIDLEGLTREEWFRKEGYPMYLINQGMLKYTRFWTETEDD